MQFHSENVFHSSRENAEIALKSETHGISMIMFHIIPLKAVSKSIRQNNTIFSATQCNKFISESSFGIQRRVNGEKCKFYSPNFMFWGLSAPSDNGDELVSLVCVFLVNCQSFSLVFEKPVISKQLLFIWDADCWHKAQWRLSTRTKEMQKSGSCTIMHFQQTEQNDDILRLQMK